MEKEFMHSMNTTDLQNALQLCLRGNNEEKKKAFEYLEACESNSKFPLALLECFMSPSAGPDTIRLEALIYLKNLINRRWNVFLPKHLTKSEASIQSAEARNKVKEIILSLIQQPFEAGITKQLIAVLAGIARFDFPAKWENLVTYFSKGLETAVAEIYKENTDSTFLSLSPSLQENLKKFLNILRAVIHEQTKKKMQPSRAHFFKISSQLIEKAYKLLKNPESYPLKQAVVIIFFKTRSYN